MAARSQEGNQDCIPDAMQEGVKAILDLHTDEELSMVWTALSSRPLPPERPERIRTLLGDVTVSIQSIRRFLSTVWDGILARYREEQGHPVRSYKTDVRQLIYQEWTRGTSSAPGNDDSFRSQSVFVPRNPRRGEVQASVSMVIEEEERRMREEIHAAEESFKEAERAIRRHRDAAALFHFLDTLRELRNVETAWRERLLSHAKRAAKKENELS